MSENNNSQTDQNGQSKKNRSGSSGNKWKYSSTATLLTFLVVVVIYFIISQAFSDSDIAWSSDEREPLEGATAPSEYYTDESGEYIYETTLLEEAVYTFYEKTGVPPYVYFLADDETIESSEDLEETAAELYDELFDDEDHFLILACCNGDEFFFTYLAGENASEVIDAEAISIFDDAIESCFEADDIPESTATAIKKAATHITQTGAKGYKAVVIIIVVAVIAVYVVFRTKKGGGKWTEDDYDDSEGRNIKYKRF